MVCRGSVKLRAVHLSNGSCDCRRGKVCAPHTPYEGTGTALSEVARANAVGPVPGARQGFLPAVRCQATPFDVHNAVPLNELCSKCLHSKCALWVMRRARWRLRALVSRSWMRWKADTSEQRALEEFAALVSLQSWRRQAIGKRKAASHVGQRAAFTIQARWRGFYARKMLARRRRFAKYSVAAAQLQRCYRAFRFRQQITSFVREMRAARVVTRSVRSYVKKRRDFRAWCHRLARYHAAIAIQMWGRRQRVRIQRKRTRRQQVDVAVRVLVKFFRWAKFMQRFGLRVRRLLEARTRAATKLQTAYRAKRARARFYLLQDSLEEQRRLEILRGMWENAYASTIQTWWRRRRQRGKVKQVLREPQATPASCYQ